MSFKDHFSDGSANYRRYRPDYPAALYQYLVGLCDKNEAVLDCATGSGQAAVGLSKYFNKVYATDASANQIESAIQHAQVEYRVAAAEQSGLDAQSLDLITVAQALHWFDFERFGQEARRILKTNGILSAWTYELFSIDERIDDIVYRLYQQLDAYWPPERTHIENQYRTIQLPLTQLSSPNFTMRAKWSFDDVIGYLNTWSAIKRFEVAHNRNPLQEVIDELKTAWGDTQSKKEVYWPLTVRVWQNK